eukprot:jgi/Mesen1/9358/ME000061S08802
MAGRGMKSGQIPPQQGQIGNNGTAPPAALNGPPSAPGGGSMYAQHNSDAAPLLHPSRDGPNGTPHHPPPSWAQYHVSHQANLHTQDPSFPHQQEQNPQNPWAAPPGHNFAPFLGVPGGPIGLPGGSFSGAPGHLGPPQHQPAPHHHLQGQHPQGQLPQPRNAQQPEAGPGAIGHGQPPFSQPPPYLQHHQQQQQLQQADAAAAAYEQPAPGTDKHQEADISREKKRASRWGPEAGEEAAPPQLQALHEQPLRGAPRALPGGDPSLEEAVQAAVLREQ